jgi:hypothetical protein
MSNDVVPPVATIASGSVGRRNQPDSPAMPLHESHSGVQVPLRSALSVETLPGPIRQVANVGSSPA